MSSKFLSPDSYFFQIKINHSHSDLTYRLFSGEGYSGSVSFEKLQEDLELQEVGPGPVLRQSKNNDEFRYFSISWKPFKYQYFFVESIKVAKNDVVRAFISSFIEEVG